MVDGTKTERGKQNDYVEVENSVFHWCGASLSSNIYKNLRTIVSNYWTFNVHFLTLGSQILLFQTSRWTQVLESYLESCSAS